MIFSSKRKAASIFKLGPAIGLTILFLSGCGEGNSSAAGAPDLLKTKAVKTVAAAAAPYTEYLDYKGFVTAKEQKMPAFVQSGIVKEIYVAEGQQVKSGEILAVLETDGIALAMEAALLNRQKIMDSYDAAYVALDLSRRQGEDMWEKSEQLYQAGAISEQDYRNASDALTNIENEVEKTEKARTNDLAQVEVSLKQCNQQLEDAVLTAPIDGIVAGVIAQSGQISGAGSPAFVLVSEEQTVNIGVSIDDIAKIALELEVAIELPGQALIKGKVTKIAPYPEQNTRTYTVEIAPAADDLTVGAIAEVKIPLATRTAVLIPLSAVWRNEGVSFVYAVEPNESGEDRVVRREVVLGEPRGALVEAVNLPPGLIIVADDIKNIKENDIVMTVPKEV
ncbi:MAG: efflux RND transporter periplasmic adaptor subunit [Gracilibacteraceae bacterium]|nr:efflux RND transporter periplasmic adaptor subunit [Gracilibacteraceae bacterium]